MQDSYESLIANHPLFYLLDKRSVRQLASLMEPVFFQANEIIVAEGESIDCIYFIASGTAEVTRTLDFIEQQNILRIAEMTKGDIIGLSATGFSSRTGLRTATVTTLSSMHLLKINLYAFFQFLKQPKIKYPDLRKVCMQFLLKHFIYSLHLFDDFSQQKIQTIAETVELLAVPSGTLLYEQGEVAEKCYYILSGQINVSILDSNEQAIFHANQIIGKTGFIYKKMRNETARVVNDSELLVLEYKSVKNFFKLNSPSFIKKIIFRALGKRHD